NQLNSARTEIEKLNDDFAVQVESDNIALLSAYDQLQLAVVLFKVDMLQAFSIDVDYVDADGD
ncbi:MAG: peptidase M75 superfamily protein, partial [Bacteroidota bacterium]